MFASVRARSLTDLFSVSRIAMRGQPAIDSWRLAGALAVILIHTAAPGHFPQSAGQTSSLSQLIDVSCRFAVPFFFVAAGYFLACARDDRAEQMQTVLKRLLPVYLFWACLYAFVFPSDQSILSVEFWLRFALYGGATPHLWFFPALMFWLIVLLAAKKVMSTRSAIAFGLGLYIACIVLGPYAGLVTDEPASIRQINALRSGFLPPVFIACGMWLRESTWRPSFETAVCVFVLGGLLQVFECLFVVPALTGAYQNSFVAGTLPFGIGAFLVALTWPAKWQPPLWTAKLGSLSLGVYAIHPMFVAMLGLVVQPSNLAMRLEVAVLTAVLSFAVVIALVRWPLVRPLIK